jgi:phage-related protein
MSDFSLTCGYTIEETPTFNTLISKFENGVEQRRAKRSGSIREFNLQCKNMIQSEFVYVRDFFLAKKGALTSFTWTNPNDSAEYTVRYKEDSLKIQRTNYQIYDFSFVLIQAL